MTTRVDMSCTPYDAVAGTFGAVAHAAPINLSEGKAFCFMAGPDEDSIRRAHEAVHLRYDSIIEVKRVTGADLRLPLTR